MVADVLNIKSSRSSGSLTLSDRQPPSGTGPVEYLQVRLDASDIMASSARIYLSESNDLACFFAELANQWQGWEGEKEWSSVENDFAISATCDRLGHIALRVTLKSGVYEDDWCVQAVIHVDAGYLQELAAQAEKFLRASLQRSTT